MQVHKSKFSLVTGTQMDHDDLIEWMKQRHMVRKPCEALARPHVQRTADDALSHAEGVALCPGDRAVIDILLAMRPHVTNMVRALSSPPYIIAPNQPALLPSAETVRYELALMSAHMPLVLVYRDGNEHLLFRVFRAELPDWVVFRYSDMSRWTQLVHLMDARLVRYMELRDDYARAVNAWPVVGRKRARDDTSE